MIRSDSPEKNKVVGGVLYLVATPIGNLSDISERALKVLSQVDFIAAEDTRNTAKLLSAFGISKPTVSYFEHNKKESGGRIVAKLHEGLSCALVTDAGTPAVSDPGEDLVRVCADEGLTVTAIPGCCAAVTALALSGLNTRRFVFEGFLEGSKNARSRRLAELADEKRTVILYEAPHRLSATLAEMKEYFGDRKIAVCRELTKLNEEIMRTTVSDAADFYGENTPRGEYVLVVDGAVATSDELFWQDMSVDRHVAYYMSAGIDKMSAIKRVAKDRGVGKSVIYAELVRSEEACGSESPDDGI